MVAGKTNRRLCTKSNVSLACLATTDLVLGLVVQPLQIAHYSFMLEGEYGVICRSLDTITEAIDHFVVLSAYSFAHAILLTEVRIIVASGLAWAVAIILQMDNFWPANITKIARFAVLFMQFIRLALVVYFNVSVYREVRRNEKQIIANQEVKDIVA